MPGAWCLAAADTGLGSSLSPPALASHQQLHASSRGVVLISRNIYVMANIVIIKKKLFCLILILLIIFYITLSKGCLCQGTPLPGCSSPHSHRAESTVAGSGSGIKIFLLANNKYADSIIMGVLTNDLLNICGLTSQT